MGKPTLVFLYGTLMRGGENHAVLEHIGARFVGSACTRSPRTLVDLGPYPALLPADDARDREAQPVQGEAFEVDDDALVELDAFEGCPTLYRREVIDIELDQGSARRASFVYVLAGQPPDGARVIAGGRYDVGAPSSRGPFCA